ncbi:MAG: ABC transporter permease [bacterium]|nr:ABC transporter permease [bacterium]
MNVDEELTTGMRVRDFIVKYGFIIITVALLVYFLATLDNFRNLGSIMSMLKFASVTAILGLGLTFSMVVGGMDLSIGSTAGLAVQLAAMTMVFYNQVGGVAIAAVLVGGLVVGLLNALLIVVLKVPDMLATLGMMFVIQGAKLIPVNGQSVSSGMVMRDGNQAPGRFTDGFRAIDGTRVDLGFVAVPLPVIIMLVLALASWFFLARTKWGRMMYAIGSNPDAARIAGIRVGFYKGLAYVICAVFASIGGMILASRIGQGDVSAGASSLLEAVAVALVGTSVLGIGKPNAWGTVLGAVLVAILVTGLTMNGFPYYFQDTAKGIVLILALIFSYTISRKRTRFVPAV